MKAIAQTKPSLVFDLLEVLSVSLLVGLLAPLSIPFYPVPLTFQNIALLAYAASRGYQKGGAAALAFYLEGALGLPVFAGGVGGLSVLMGPTGGYLVGYVVASYATGFLAEHRSKLFSLLVGSVLIYLFGVPYLATFFGLSKAIFLGCLPFLFGDLCKIAIALEWKRFFRKM
jgi:biotin transport system substrate-specific component